MVNNLCPICKVNKKNLQQHLNKKHKDISKEEYYKIIGKTEKSKCLLCGKEDYILELKHKACAECFDKYHIECEYCGKKLLWSVALHYTKVHPDKPLPINAVEVKKLNCSHCGKPLDEVIRVPFGTRKREIIRLCSDCDEHKNNMS